MKNPSKNNKHFLLIGAVVGLLLVLWGLWCYLAFRNVGNARSRVVVERQSWYEIDINGQPVLYYTLADSDSVLTDLAQKRDTAITKTIAFSQWTNNRWWWPSCHGTITASLDTLVQPTFSPVDIIDINLIKAEKHLKELDDMSDEMDYYFSVHNVQDEGYELVTDYYEKTINQISDLSGVIAQLKKCLSSDTVTITHKALYRAIYKNKEGRQSIDTCVLISQQPFKYPRRSRKLALKTILQLKSEDTPSGVKVASYRKDSDLRLTYGIQHRSVAKEDTLNGLGLKVTPKHGVQIGVWKNGKYKGEQIEYNSNRIYGIDISRYQHEKGRKRYNINWNNLRITSLGHISKKKISGRVNYPVSFVYIKATQGRKIKNRYFAVDYMQAKRHGLKVGNYHFFSTRCSGAVQAKWYLRHSHYEKGDLPPVLDLEPTPAQIRAMGGPVKMFKEVRTWLKAVRSVTGKKPILYVSQKFVNNYLGYAPDLKQNYQVWIAKYGEYRPDVHMLYWQLSPDGHVSGITPAVDINVFNGYKDKYDDFIRKL